MISVSARLFSIPLVLLSQALPLFAGEPTLLIETDFSNQTPGQAIVGVEGEDLPLKFPSWAVAEKGSSLIAGKEPIGNLKPPFALYQAGGRDDDSSAVAYVGMTWDLLPEGMTEGVFELTATITPLDYTIYGGRLIVEFLDHNKQLIHSDPPLHPLLCPAQIGFSGSNLRAVFQGADSVERVKDFPFQAEQTYEIKMVVNLTAREWSWWLDGTEVESSIPFPSQMSADAYPILMLSRVSLTSEQGADAKPDARYVLSKLTFKRLSE